MKKSKIIFLILDIFFITAAFFFFIWLKPATKSVYLPQYYKPFLGFAVIWIVISLIGNKFNITSKKKISDLVIPIIRINFTILAIISILIFIFHSFHYSRLIVLGTILLTTFLEIFFVSIYYFHKKLVKNTDFSSSLTTKPKYIEPNSLDYECEEFNFTLPEIENISDSIYSNLREHYFVNYTDVFEFIDSNLKLKNIPQNESLILSTHTIFNIENIEQQSQQLFINLHKINDVRRINGYLIKVNENLKYGGYFVGCGSTIERYKKIINRYPPVLNYIFYGTDFIFKRVFPKLPVLKKFYFAITKGENRAISESELLGRLCFCGFKIIDTKEIDNSFYFIAQKINKQREDSGPSYGPFIKLKRIGKDGEVINVYKFRTMHPYSEYLQNYIHEKYQLEDCGKFKNDLRITGWGKILRKLFIDELPQFINLFRGEISLVGVRALSEHYFSLYPKDMQKLRTQYKPGLVPPYYVDMPKSFEEILESERKYLSLKQTHPYSTDIRYFFKAWYNIIFKGVRSK
jgi:lipopolysaccharide/colanic/teichoic acid biosynthesis glycosyltransferase